MFGIAFCQNGDTNTEESHIYPTLVEFGRGQDIKKSYNQRRKQALLQIAQQLLCTK